jgi:elongation factor Ts
MAVEPALVKKLRETTGAGILDCQKALAEVGGDFDKAIEFLRRKGLASAEKKAGREARDGSVGSYIHAGGKLGVLVEVNCETDFVAKTPDFQELVKDVAMQVAAANPRYVSREEIPGEVIEAERRIYTEQAKDSGKPQPVWEKIATGKLDKFYSDVCLLEQAFVKNPEISVRDLIAQRIAKLGENIVVRRFARFRLGEE